MFFILGRASIYLFQAGATEKSQNHRASLHRGTVLYRLSPPGGMDAAGRPKGGHAAGADGGIRLQARFQNGRGTQSHQKAYPGGLPAA